MSESHCIAPVDLHIRFNDPLGPWERYRVGNAVPDSIAVFQPVQAATLLTSRWIQAEFGAGQSSVIYDCKHNAFLVLLLSRAAVRTVVKQAAKLPAFNIFQLDGGYEHLEDTCGRITDWIVQQVEDQDGDDDDGDDDGASDLGPEDFENVDFDGLASFGDDNVDDDPGIHEQTLAGGPETLATQSAPLEELEESLSLGEQDLNVPLNLEHDPAPPDEIDVELSGPPSSPLTTEDIQSAYEQLYRSYHQEIHHILQTLVHTGPTEIREREELHQILSRPLRTDFYDVELEEALRQAVFDARDIALATGDETTLAETYAAIVTARQNLGLGPLPDILEDQ